MMPLHETVPIRGVANRGGVATVAATKSASSRAVTPSTLGDPPPSTSPCQSRRNAPRHSFNIRFTAIKSF